MARSLAERAVVGRGHAPPHRRRRDRTQFSASDLRRLESVFIVDRYPDIILREQLASDLSVSEDRIQVKLILPVSLRTQCATALWPNLFITGLTIM